MKTQRGFLQLPLMGWAAVATAVLVTALSATIWIQTKRLEHKTEEHATFVAETAAIGKQAKREADAQRIADQRNKERTDEEYARGIVAHRTELQRLRDYYASRSIVPPAPATSGRPDLACFDRAEFVAAGDRLTKRVLGLADKGAESTIGLDAAKRGAQR